MGSTIVDVPTFIFSESIVHSYDVIIFRLSKGENSSPLNQYTLGDANRNSRTTEGELRKRDQKETQKSGLEGTGDRRK